MAFFVSDLLELDILKGCELITARETGGSREIRDVGIYDYEYLSTSKKDNFYEGDFVISTFLYARHNEDFLKDGIKSLIKNNIACLAIKKVYFDRLSEELAAYCNENNFPVFFFDENIYVENIIYQVKKSLDYEHSLYGNSQLLDEIINFDESDIINSKMKNLHIPLSEKFLSIFIGGNGYVSANGVLQLLDEELVSRRVFSGYHRNGLLLTFSFEKKKEKMYRELLDKSCGHLAWKLDCSVGVSRIYSGGDDLSYSFRESCFSSTLSGGLNKNVIYYEDSGYYKIYMNIMNDRSINRYYSDLVLSVEKYDKENNTSLFDTMIRVVEYDYNISKTAEALFQHPNTVRYRINKIHSVFFPGSSEKEFYDQINFLVKLHKLKQGSL